MKTQAERALYRQALLILLAAQALCTCFSLRSANLDRDSFGLNNASNENGLAGFQSTYSPSVAIPLATQTTTSVAGSISQASAVSVVSQFTGVSYSVQDPFYPPDSQVAVSPSFVVEAVNSLMAIYTRQGVQVSNSTLQSFFNILPTREVYDSKIIYDATSMTWFFSTEDFTVGVIHLAVSQTPDPTAGWFQYQFAPAAGCPDQPILGVNDVLVAVSVNIFSCNNGVTSGGAEYWIISKNDLLAGNLYYQSFGPSPNLCSVHPVDSLTSTSVLYMVSTGCGLFNTLKLFRITGIPPGQVNSNSVDIPTRQFPIPPKAQQLGSTYPIDTGDSRVLDAKWDAGFLWFSTHEACNLPGDNLTRSCLRLLQVDTQAVRIVQDFDVGAVGVYYFYPALSPDGQGNLIVVFASSSSSTFPSLMVAARAATDPPNSLESPRTLVGGLGPEGTYCVVGRGCRYGDFFEATPDPVQPHLVWVVGQVPSWTTYISSISYIPGSSETVTVSADAKLTSDLYCSTLTISPGVTLTTDGYNIYCTDKVLNQGAIVTGTDPFQDYPNSYGGSGGGGTSSLCNAAGSKGFSTLVEGGQGANATSGANGQTPASPTLSTNQLQAWYKAGFSSYLGGAGGEAVCNNLGGAGGFGLYMQASDIVAGAIIAQGQAGAGNCTSNSLSGGGGGGTIILAYGSGGYTPGPANIAGGIPAPCNGTVSSGSGGNGRILTYNYGNTPPVLTTLIPTNVQTGFKDASGIITGGLSVNSTSRTLSGLIFFSLVNATTGTRFYSRTVSVTVPFDPSGTAHFVVEASTSPYWLANVCTADAYAQSIDCFLSRTPDIAHSGSVNIVDVSIVDLQLGLSRESTSYNPQADLTGTGRVTIVSVSIVLLYYGSAVYKP